jgi:hypothetical protein
MLSRSLAGKLADLDAPDRCEQCHVPMPPPPPKSRRLYCSEGCRRTAQRARELLEAA